MRSYRVRVRVRSEEFRSNYASLGNPDKCYKYELRTYIGLNMNDKSINNYYIYIPMLC